MDPIYAIISKEEESEVRNLSRIENIMIIERNLQDRRQDKISPSVFIDIAI
jgi:hypothetical protein